MSLRTYLFPVFVKISFDISETVFVSIVKVRTSMAIVALFTKPEIGLPVKKGITLKNMNTKIYVEELLPLEEALPLITDRWIESAKYCDETITTMRDALKEVSAKMSERKTVHQWLNDLGIPREEAGRPLCLLRRLSITCERLRAYPIETDDVEAVVAFIAMRTGLRKLQG